MGSGGFGYTGRRSCERLQPGSGRDGSSHRSFSSRDRPSSPAFTPFSSKSPPHGLEAKPFDVRGASGGDQQWIHGQIKRRSMTLPKSTCTPVHLTRSSANCDPGCPMSKSGVRASGQQFLDLFQNLRGLKPKLVIRVYMRETDFAVLVHHVYRRMRQDMVCLTGGGLEINLV